MRDTCGDLWLGFEENDLNHWAQKACLQIGQSSFLSLRNGFQIQIRVFKRNPRHLIKRKSNTLGKKETIMAETHLFTSESVSEGHPDKMADQISDAILDALLAQDKRSRVACETLVKTGMVMVAGEITTDANVDVESLVREWWTRLVQPLGERIRQQHLCRGECHRKAVADIAMGVDESEEHEQGAGDQGLMFGYATNETDVLMPAPIYYSHLLVKKQSDVRKIGKLDWLEPDAKSQLSFRYEGGKPVGIDAVVLSTQHKESIAPSDLHEAEMEEIIKPVLPAAWCDASTKYLINPTGRFVIGGPHGDCGLTGRKIIVDTYGGMARHGGGAFSERTRQSGSLGSLSGALRG